MSEKLLTDYLHRRELEISACESALASDDFNFLKRTGHNLKGNGSMYGFPQISEIGKTLEDASSIMDRKTLKEAIHEYQILLTQLNQKSKSTD